jgi:hypothetical protein
MYRVQADEPLVVFLTRLTGDTHIPACNHCKQARVNCDRSFNVRFRDGLDLDNNYDIVFPERDIWPRPIGPCKYYLLESDQVS